ncbi:hypothetical protein MSG28_007256 [Choristoneura fumiferana]|uniref:Uncharacterized protein n=1 Tax=Choristoneura fumiferana TaxID=7141 RepID=A0ACC0JWD4_CHOFU|nr:hypothetical protein MSG28_007256 [Choristoneura fumiferana]
MFHTRRERAVNKKNTCDAWESLVGQCEGRETCCNASKARDTLGDKCLTTCVGDMSSEAGRFRLTSGDGCRSIIEILIFICLMRNEIILMTNITHPWRPPTSLATRVKRSAARSRNFTRRRWLHVSQDICPLRWFLDMFHQNRFSRFEILNFIVSGIKNMHQSQHHSDSSISTLLQLSHRLLGRSDVSNIFACSAVADINAGCALGSTPPSRMRRSVRVRVGQRAQHHQIIPIQTNYTYRLFLPLRVRPAYRRAESLRTRALHSRPSRLAVCSKCSNSNSDNSDNSENSENSENRIRCRTPKINLFRKVCLEHFHFEGTSAGRIKSLRGPELARGRTLPITGPVEKACALYYSVAAVEFSPEASVNFFKDALKERRKLKNSFEGRHDLARMD